MQINDKFFYINIRDYLALGNDNKAGEPMLARVLSGFSCPKKQDVANFLKRGSSKWLVNLAFSFLTNGSDISHLNSFWYSFNR